MTNTIKGLNFNAEDAFVVEPSEKKDTILYWLRDTTLINQDTRVMFKVNGVTLKDKDGKTKWQVEVIAKINDKELENLNNDEIHDFVMWDLKFNEKQGFTPNVFMDKKGRQTILLEEGANFIACKATDKSGLENVEVIKLWSNGAVKKVLFD